MQLCHIGSQRHDFACISLLIANIQRLVIRADDRSSDLARAHPPRLVRRPYLRRRIVQADQPGLFKQNADFGQSHARFQAAFYAKHALIGAVEQNQPVVPVIDGEAILKQFDRFAQAAFRQMAFGDVALNGDEVDDDPIVVMHGRHVHLDQIFAPALRIIHDLRSRRLAQAHRFRYALACRRVGSGAIQKLARLAADYFFREKPGRSDEGRIDPDDIAVPVIDDDDVIGLFRDLRQAAGLSLAFLQSLARLAQRDLGGKNEMSAQRIDQRKRRQKGDENRCGDVGHHRRRLRRQGRICAVGFGNAGDC